MSAGPRARRSTHNFTRTLSSLAFSVSTGASAAPRPPMERSAALRAPLRPVSSGCVIEALPMGCGKGWRKKEVGRGRGEGARGEFCIAVGRTQN